MPKTSFLRNYSKTSKTPRRPFEKERIDGELKLVGEYGLRNKRELWRTQLALAKIRKSARALLTLEPKDPKRMFEAPALLRRLQRYGLVEDSEIYAAGAAKFWADVRSAALSPQKKSPPTPAGEARGDAGIRARAQSGGKRRAHDGGRE